MSLIISIIIGAILGYLAYYVAQAVGLPYPLPELLGILVFALWVVGGAGLTERFRRF